MSKIYICAVSPQFPENYEIGVRTGTWGVTGSNRRRIEVVRPGDRLVFIVAGRFRSIHEVVTGPYEDHRLLWPPREGDVYPHRIRIGPPEAFGIIPVPELASRISFMRGKRWSGTIMGRNGVFNDRATIQDLELIRMALLAGPRLEERPDLVRPVDKPILEETGGGLDSLLDRLAELSRLSPAPGFRNPFDAAESWGRGLLAGVYTDWRQTPTFAVAPLGRSPSDTVLSTLYGLSSLKQADPSVKRVQGKIFVHAAPDAILPLISGVPNLEAIVYDVRVSLRS